MEKVISWLLLQRSKFKLSSKYEIKNFEIKLVISLFKTTSSNYFEEQNKISNIIRRKDLMSSYFML